MAYRGSKLVLCDNSGARTVRVLQIYGHAQARVGDIILSVLEKKRKRVKIFFSKKINHCFVVSQRMVLFRNRGFYYVRFDKNACLMLGVDHDKLLSTRNYGLLTLESYKKSPVGFLKSCRNIV